MAIGRLPQNVRITDANGLPTMEFQRAWNAMLKAIGGGAENGPSTPTGLAYSFEQGGVLLSCNKNAAAEQIVGYQWRIGDTWTTAEVFVPLGANTYLAPKVGTGTWTIWVAAQDVRGNFSTPASMSVTITLADLGIYGPVVNVTAIDRAAFLNLKNSAGLTPASITLSAEALNLPTPVYAWKVDDVLQVGEVASTFVLPAFTGTAKVVRCDVTSGTDTAYDTISIFSLSEGDDGLQAGLSNENQSISVDAGGTPTAGLPATSSMIVVRGVEILASGVVYSLVSAVGCTASINASTGAISVSAISADVATATFRATVTASGTVLDKIMNLNKSYPGDTGSTGPDGPRGSLKGNGSQYSISSGSWSDLKANRVISNMLTGAVLTTDLATTTHLRIGDTVTLTNGTNFIATKFWGGASWLSAGSIIEGNLLVNGSGTFTGDITGASNLNISGTARFEGSAAVGGVTAALAANASFGSTNGLVGWTNNASGYGAQGIGSTSGFGGVLAYSTASAGKGLHAIATGAFGDAIYAQQSSATGYALRLDGKLGWGGYAWTAPDGTAKLMGADGSWWQVGTSTGNIPINNGTVCTNLNAQYLNGNASTAFLGASATAADSSKLGTYAVTAFPRITGSGGVSPGAANSYLTVTNGSVTVKLLAVLVP